MDKVNRIRSLKGQSNDDQCPTISSRSGLHQRPERKERSWGVVRNWTLAGWRVVGLIVCLLYFFSVCSSSLRGGVLCLLLIPAVYYVCWLFLVLFVHTRTQSMPRYRCSSRSIGAWAEPGRRSHPRRDRRLLRLSRHGSAISISPRLAASGSSFFFGQDRRMVDLNLAMSCAQCLHCLLYHAIP